MNFKMIVAHDWSRVEDELLSNVNMASSYESATIENLGIYRDVTGCHTSSYAGIRKAYNSDGSIVKVLEGDLEKELVVCVYPRFKINQWKMLTEVMQDPEYEKYIAGDEHRLFKIFLDEGTISTETTQGGGELLLVISYIRSCLAVCRKQLKKQMSFVEENLNGRVKGAIKVSNQLKVNVSRGRLDRLYCRYPYFTLDTTENRILKKALEISEAYLQKEHLQLPDLWGMVKYCKNALRSVKNDFVKSADFAKVNTKGFNSYYKQPIELAKLILKKCTMDLEQNAEVEKSVIPYAINMELLFELYVRASIKKFIKLKKLDDFYRLDSYKTPNDDDVLRTYDEDETKDNYLYLMLKYIPDILVQHKDSQTGEWKNMAVFDVKYQNSTKKAFKDARRHNSHQLLFYTLLLNVSKCGFIFPCEEDSVESVVSCSLMLQNGVVSGPEREYTQWYVDFSGNNCMPANLIEYLQKDM